MDTERGSLGQRACEVSVGGRKRRSRGAKKTETKKETGKEEEEEVDDHILRGLLFEEKERDRDAGTGKKMQGLSRHDVNRVCAERPPSISIFSPKKSVFILLECFNTNHGLFPKLNLCFWCLNVGGWFGW